MRHRPGRAPVRLAADQRGGVAERIPGIVDSAMDAVAPERLCRLRRERAAPGEPRVGLVVAGQPRDGDAMRRADGRSDARRHKASSSHRRSSRTITSRAPATHLFGVTVDREVMAELHQVREAECGRAVFEPGLRMSETGELGIGGGEQHDIPRRLAEVHGVRAVLDGARLRGEQVQGLGPFSRGLRLRRPSGLAGRGRSRRGGSPAPRAALPVAVEVAVDAGADRLHHQPPPATGHIEKSLGTQDTVRGCRGAQAAPRRPPGRRWCRAPSRSFRTHRGRAARRGRRGASGGSRDRPRQPHPGRAGGSAARGHGTP